MARGFRGWRSLASLFGRNARTNRARLRLIDAYQAVFQGSPTKEDQELVLADLANMSGFFRATLPDVPDAELRHREGMRALYAMTIEDKLTISSGDYQALKEAARAEAVADIDQQQQFQLQEY